jgi:hypothetical protein
MQASISSGYRNDIALHGGWDSHSSALVLQTQQKEPVWYLKSVIPAMQEAEMGELQFESSQNKKVSKCLSQKTNWV